MMLYKMTSHMTVNDVFLSCTVVGFSVFIYADNIKLLSSNSLKLQTIQHTGENWSMDWQLKTQSTKSELKTFSFKPAANSINEFCIKPIFLVQDLGITLSSDFKLQTYISRFFAKSVNFVYLFVKTF